MNKEICRVYCLICCAVCQSLTQHDQSGKKATSTPTLGSNANNAYNANPRAPASGGSLAASRRSLAKSAAPPSDGKLIEVLANYKKQLEASERTNELKLPKISPRPGTDAAKRPTTDKQWMSLPEVDPVTSSSSSTSSATSEERGNSGNKTANTKTGEVATPPVGLPRRLTPFRGSVITRSRDHRKY